MLSDGFNNMLTHIEQLMGQLHGLAYNDALTGLPNRVSILRSIQNVIDRNDGCHFALLFLDFDLYEPTKAAIEHLVPRMPSGAIIALDELDNPIWPGETQALLDTVGIRNLRLERIEWDPYIAYAVID